MQDKFTQENKFKWETSPNPHVSRLKLRLHENKITVRKLRQGIDFLGYVVLPNCVVLRTKTKRRMLRRVNSDNLSSYLGLLEHCKGSRLENNIYKIVDLAEKVSRF